MAKIKKKLRRQLDNLVDTAAILEDVFLQNEQYRYFCEYIRINNVVVVDGDNVTAAQIESDVVTDLMDAILSIPSGFRSNSVPLEVADDYIDDMRSLWKEWSKLLDDLDLTA